MCLQMQKDSDHNILLARRAAKQVENICAVARLFAHLRHRPEAFDLLKTRQTCASQYVAQKKKTLQN